MIAAKVKHYILENELILPGSRILVAISGGIDSVAMLHILNDLKDELRIELVAGHVNHSMRGKESDGDEDFTAQLCKEMQIELFSATLNPENWNKSGNKQDLARELRYQHLNNWLNNSNCDYLATAHHATDQVETFLERLLRGSGIDGLSGIPVKRDHIIRPILCLSRQEIENYSQKHAIAWRDDKSNNNTKYFRNKLRHIVLPVLGEVKTDSLRQITNAVKRIAEAGDALAYCANEQLEKSLLLVNSDTIRIDTRTIREYPSGLRTAIWREACRKLVGESLFGFMESHWRSIDRLATENRQNNKLDLPNQLIARTEKDVLVLSSEIKFQVDQFDQQITIPGECEFEYGSLISRLINPQNETIRYSYNEVFFDLDKLELPLTFRNIQKGDKISLPNLGFKKVSRIFSDCHVPEIYRRQIPVLLSKNDIIWVCGLRRSDHAMIGDKTRSIVGIKYQPKSFKLIGGQTLSVLE